MHPLLVQDELNPAKIKVINNKDISYLHGKQKVKHYLLKIYKTLNESTVNKSLPM